MNHFFTVTLPILSLGITSIMQTWQIHKLSERIRDIQNALALREWIDAINNGESASDIAYLREKGILK